MPRDLILGTAGHIDHGKTSLVKALTGIDTDRLPEEKARGITIDIGFATLDLGDYCLGIVDVPGHERFIKNMLAGATGVDLAVLVVAADDSVMPQTREHLEILRLLGLRHGVIALTKCDLVDETTLEVVELEIRDLVRGSFLDSAPIVRTSAHSGQGLDELKAAILNACKPRDESASPGGALSPGLADSSRGLASAWFRMPIDRAFVVQGHGTVVTGSVLSGSVRIGDEVDWQPRGEKVRVRSLQNHDRPVDEVHRGMRAAINLAGVRLEDVLRGQELATPGFLQPSRVVTVRLHCLTDTKRPIKHRAPVRFHVGTAEIMGTVSLLDCDTVQPGEWALAQLFLDEPATTTWGQPFVVRGPSATQTLGGGQVLQPVAKKVRRRHLNVLVRIEQLWTGQPEQRALTVAWFGGYAGFTQADLVRGANLAPDEALALMDKLRADHKLVGVTVGHNRQVVLHADVVKELDERIFAELGKLHADNPLMTSHDRQKVQAQLAYVGDDALVHAEVERLLKARQLVGDLRRIARADFKPKLSANLRKLKDKVVAAYEEAAFQPPDPASFANQAGGNAANLNDLFDVCIAEGFLVSLGGDVFLPANAEAEMRRRVAERLADGSSATVAEIRDLLGTTRKYAVPFCEYLDRVGVTRRDGDVRYLAEPKPSAVQIVPAEWPMRKRYLFGLIALFVVSLLVGVYVTYRVTRQRALEEILVELEQADPGWQLDDIELARPAVPAEEDSAALILKLHARLPAKWRQGEAKAEGDLNWRELSPHEPLPPQHAAFFALHLATIEPLLPELRQLADRPRGRFVITYTKDMISTLLPHAQQVREIAGVLRQDALWQAHEGNLETALLTCRAGLNTARSLDGEPLLISQLVRAACLRESLAGLQRTLAAGEPSALPLPAVQQALLDADRHDSTVVSLRGERAGLHRLCSNLENGSISTGGLARMLAARPGGAGIALTDHAQGMVLTMSVPVSHIWILRHLTDCIAAAQLPGEQQDARVKELNQLPGQAPMFAKLITPAWTRCHAAFRRGHAQLRCAAVAVAAERYRLKHGRWPADLAVLVPDFLAALPADPFTDQPLQYRKTPDGIVVFSVGADRANRGDFRDRLPEAAALVPAGHENDAELEFRLWDPEARRR